MFSSEEVANDENSGLLQEMFATLQAHVDAIAEQKDAAYKERNLLLMLLVKACINMGYKAGLGKHDPEDTNWEADWRNIVFLEIPTARGKLDTPVQCSWHIHDSELENFSFLYPYPKPWDGHTTEEKYRRIREAEFF